MIKEKDEFKLFRLKGSDFVQPPRPKEQCICLLFGQAGEGKTTFGLSGAPDPVAYFDIDRRGLHAARKAMRRGKQIGYMKIEMPKNLRGLSDQAVKKLAGVQWKKIERNFARAVEGSAKGDVRTIVLDTVTELCDLANLAVTGRTDTKTDDFGKSKHIVKVMISDLVKSSRDGSANLIMLARAKDVYSGRDKTGKFTYQGLDCLEYDADWAGHLRLVTDRKTKRKEREHELEITKAGINLKQLGEVYTPEQWKEYGGPFVYACVKNYPGTKAEDWQ